MSLKGVLFLIHVCISISLGHTTQRPNRDDESNPFLDLASNFVQETIANQNGNAGGAGLAGVASLIGNLMQGGDGKSNGAAQILSGIGSMLGSGRSDGGGIDPQMISNVIELFTSGDDSNDDHHRPSEKESLGVESFMQIASLFMNQGNNKQGDGLSNFIPLIMQAISSYNGPQGRNIKEKHKDHGSVLPPILEQIHVMWDYFSNTELAQTLWEKTGISKVFKGFTDNEGKIDYDRLFESLHNQSFRRHWIKLATLYLAEWVKYIAQPEVYQRYIQTGQAMVNGYLKMYGFPKSALIDSARPVETISNFLNYASKQHFRTKADAKSYVKPAVTYIQDLFKMAQTRGFLQKFNASELSDKLTDTLNLEIIEPVLKIHRGYHHAIEIPHCDKYILCELNSHDPNEKLGLPGFKAGIMKFGSMAAAWFVSTETNTPFWDLINVVNEPYDCTKRFPVDCSQFHEGEAKVKTEYVHTEL